MSPKSPSGAAWFAFAVSFDEEFTSECEVGPMSLSVAQEFRHGRQYDWLLLVLLAVSLSLNVVMAYRMGRLHGSAS